MRVGAPCCFPQDTSVFATNLPLENLALSQNDGDPDWPAFRVALTLTDAEIVSFQRIVVARQRKASVVTRVLAVVLASFAAAWLGGWLMTKAAIVQSADWELAAAI